VAHEDRLGESIWLYGGVSDQRANGSCTNNTSMSPENRAVLGYAVLGHLSHDTDKNNATEARNWVSRHTLVRKYGFVRDSLRLETTTANATLRYRDAFLAEDPKSYLAEAVERLPFDRLARPGNRHDAPPQLHHDSS
jgi:hypothetical protein